jgi:hypothetical protein
MPLPATWNLEQNRCASESVKRPKVYGLEHGACYAALSGGPMIYIVLNATAILFATLASLAFGALYYSAASRGRPRAGGLAATLVTAFIAEFWLCAILAGALILAPPKGGVWTMTLGSAFVIWIGFVVPAILATYRVRALDIGTALIDCAHWLGAMLMMAVVLRLVGLVPPPT